MKGIWNGLCPEWFEVLNGEEAALSTDDVELLEIHAEESCKLDSYFVMRFSNGTTRNVKLLEQLVFKSFYANKKIFEIAKPPSCALLDIILAKGGPEAITESFYNAMRNQQQSGGQLNETLVRRTKVQWCLPSLKQSEDLIKEGVSLYLKGDKNMKAHRGNFFSSSRAKQYGVSKVVDRIDEQNGHCPFLAKH